MLWCSPKGEVYSGKRKTGKKKSWTLYSAQAVNYLFTSLPNVFTVDNGWMYEAKLPKTKSTNKKGHILERCLVFLRSQRAAPHKLSTTSTVVP
jgi:hypothetical protein